MSELEELRAEVRELRTQVQNLKRRIEAHSQSKDEHPYRPHANYHAGTDAPPLPSVPVLSANPSNFPHGRFIVVDSGGTTQIRVMIDGTVKSVTIS